MPNRRSTTTPPLALARHGSLDVPLTVWTVADEADLVQHLLAELDPPGPVAAVGLPGWTAIPGAGWDTEYYLRGSAAARRAVKALPAGVRARVRTHAVCETTLAGNLAVLRGTAGTVFASSWLLRCASGVAAAVTALRPGGHLVVLGSSDRDAVDIATLTDAGPGTAQALLSFAAYLVAAQPAVLDTAAEAAGHRTGQARPGRCWGIGIWRKKPVAQGGGADA